MGNLSMNSYSTKINIEVIDYISTPIYYKYKLTEGNLPFHCEHKNISTGKYCPNDAFNIFYNKQASASLAPLVGTALCKKHEHSVYISNDAKLQF